VGHLVLVLLVTKETKTMSENEIIKVSSAVEININCDINVLSRNEAIKLIEDVAKVLGIQIALNL